MKLHEIILSKNGKQYNVLYSALDEEYFPGAKLSPFPNRVNHGNYNFMGKEYQLEINAPPHALHGLKYKIPFNSSPGYPFSYHIEVENKTENNCFSCTTKILNTSKCPIPIGDGWHPYFTTGSKINTLKIQLPPNRQLELKDHIPTGRYIESKWGQEAGGRELKNIELDHCYELINNPQNPLPETRLIDEQKNIIIVVWQKMPGYRYLQLYTPPDRNSIAIEPMSCAPDAFNNKMGLCILQPGETIEFCFGVRLE